MRTRRHLGKKLSVRPPSKCPSHPEAKNCSASQKREPIRCTITKRRQIPLTILPDTLPPKLIKHRKSLLSSLLHLNNLLNTLFWLPKQKILGLSPSCHPSLSLSGHMCLTSRKMTETSLY